MENQSYVTLKADDSTSLQAYVARPEGVPRAGLMVLQEAFGVNPHIRDIAERFAREGYLAIAPDLFHRTSPGLTGGYKEFPAMVPHIRAIKDTDLEADIRAAHSWLVSELPQGVPVCSIGYCMGGRAACMAALTVPLAGAVSYYGGGIGPHQFFDSLVDRLPDIGAPILMFWGGLDRNIPVASIRLAEDKLTEVKKPFTSVTFSYADHGFFCDARSTYNAEAAAQSWTLTKEFLAACLKETFTLV